MCAFRIKGVQFWGFPGSSGPFQSVPFKIVEATFAFSGSLVVATGDVTGLVVRFGGLVSGSLSETAKSRLVASGSHEVVDMKRLELKSIGLVFGECRFRRPYHTCTISRSRYSN
jgi:hypothetical protein